MVPDKQRILEYITFKTSRSGGKGGQHVNKVSSKVEVVLHVPSADFLSDEEKTLLMSRLAHQIDKIGNLHVIAQEDRSQLANKETAIEKLILILENALKVDKPRKPTKIPKAVIRKRLENKHSKALKKEMRKRPRFD
jgi:ribosome-associated protein